METEDERGRLKNVITYKINPAHERKKYQNVRRWKITKYHSTPRNMPAFQGWIEPLNLPTTQIDEESEKNPN